MQPQGWQYLELKLSNPMDKQEVGVLVPSVGEDQLAGHPGLDFVLTDWLGSHKAFQ